MYPLQKRKYSLKHAVKLINKIDVLDGDIIDVIEMRIYSNKLLSLPHIIHTLHNAKPPTAGRWGNLYFFHIQHVQPLMITAYSSVKLLQENRKYYCYDNYYRNKQVEKLGNTSEIISEIPVYIPKASMTNDVIIVSDDNPSEYPSLTVPVWLKTYSPTLL
jgi:hypothetical protein